RLPAPVVSREGPRRGALSAARLGGVPGHLPARALPFVRDTGMSAVPEAGAAFAPEDPAFVADPYPVYAALRGDRPVAYDEATDHWLVTRHADVNALLRDRRCGRTYLHVASHEGMGRTAPPAWQEPFWTLINAGILDMEGPDHARVRRLVSKAF